MIRPELARREEILIERRVDGVPLEGQAVLFEQYALLRRTWKWVLLVSIVAAAAAGAYVVLYVPKEYKATIRIVPPNKTGSPLDNIIGGMSASLKDFGLGKLVGGKSGESGYSRVALLFSRSMVDSLMAKYDLYADYDIDRSRPDLLREAIRDNIDIEVDLEGPIDISVYDTDPKRAAAMTSDLVSFADHFSAELNRRETEPISRTIGKRYDQVRAEQEDVTVRLRAFMQDNKIFDVEKQSSIVGTALYEAEAEVRAQRILVESLAATLGEQDARVIEQRQILARVESEARKLAAGQGSVIQGPSIRNAPSAAVEGIKLQTAYEINAKVLALLQPMYEQSVLDQKREIPIFHVIDAPTVPLKKARPRYSLVIAGAFLGAWVVCYVVIALISYARAFNRRYRAYALATGTNGLPRN
jgi:tyrosine-protein kinase Etk/Wzc